MAHHTLTSGYARLVERLNRFPQGAPASDVLFNILRLLFSVQEAELVAQLPIKPFTVKQASTAWKMDLTSTRKILDTLAERAILVDIERDGESVYVLPPPMAGFFEFALMRVRTDLDQQLFSELLYQYLNVEDDFVKELFLRGETRPGRTFVHEPALSAENVLHVLDYERASAVIRQAAHRAVSLCYCRHKMAHLKRACTAPLDICMTFGNTAASLIKHGAARSFDAAEGLALLQTAYDHHLVQFGENAREGVNFICNCCGCCCEALIAARRFGLLHPIHTTNFLPEIQTDACTGCGKCVQICPVEAMTLVSANDPARSRRLHPKLNAAICLGCGLCVRACPKQSIRLQSRPQRVITPVNGTHKVVMMALERGKLQNLIFDQQVLWSHRALAAVLGVILKLPPIKQVLASQQLKSRYLEALLRSKSQAKSSE